MKTALKTALLTVAGLVFAACGNPAAQFVGHYSTDGKMTVDFREGIHDVVDIGGSTDLFEGTTSDLVIVMYDDCMIRIDMDDFDSGNVVGEKDCRRELSESETLDETFDSGSIVFNGAIATVTLHADIVDTYHGEPHDGEVEYELTLTKLTK